MRITEISIKSGSTVNIVYQDRRSEPSLLGSAECGQLFNPALDAAAFTQWASLNNLLPDGAIVCDGAIVGPGWIRGRVRLRRESMRIATARKLRRARAAKKDCRQ